MSLTDKQLYTIAIFRLREQMGIPQGVEVPFSKLGQGEYNVNYLFTHPVTGQQLVLRYNTGSQMGLADQIGYEFYALQLLCHSGRTPQPYYLDSQRRLLVMEYLPGRPLDYSTDLALAAACLADIHAVPVPDDCRLLCPPDPLQAMLEECRRMAGVYLQSDKADKSIKQRLVRLLGAAGRSQRDSALMRRTIVNTELNSGNFLINGPDKPNYLIDWEKPLLAEPAQDLGHFLAPTTTYWKTDILLEQEEKRRFLQTYHAAAGAKEDFTLLQSRTRDYERMTCLRGVTWCAMAWVEYQSPDRPIQNQSTCRKIQDYLSAEFLDWIGRSYFA